VYARQNVKDSFDVLRITDPQTLRALAHPLRFDLIELLGALGPMTAAECARRLDTSQASCSYHLRLLAKYGFVEAAPAGTDGRERPWRLTDLEQSWGSATGPAVDQLERVFVEREAGRMLGWIERKREDAPAWVAPAFLGGMTLPLTPPELTSVRDELRAVLEPYVVRLGDPGCWPAGTRLVRVLLSAVPLDPAETANDHNPEGGPDGNSRRVDRRSEPGR
jgi:DNA-binding transcriptional ArsR family regulator